MKKIKKNRSFREVGEKLGYFRVKLYYLKLPFFTVRKLLLILITVLYDSTADITLILQVRKLRSED